MLCLTAAVEGITSAPHERDRVIGHAHKTPETCILFLFVIKNRISNQQSREYVSLSVSLLFVFIFSTFLCQMRHSEFVATRLG